MNTPSILTAVLALALAAPLSAQTRTPSPKKAQKTEKIHSVSLGARASGHTAAPAPKEKAAKMRMAQEEPAETVYDYASCGCF